MRVVDRIVVWLNSPAAQRASRALARLLAGQRHRRATRWLAGAAWRWLASPGCCCEEGGSHHRFLQRYASLLAGSAALARLRRYLLEGELGEVSDRLEALARIALLGTLRHAALASSGRTPRLIEVQLAPYPACDLACRGCYALGEHGVGRPPDRARLGFLVDEAARCGALAIHVVGKGEPFLTRAQADDLLAVVADRPHLLFVVATHAMRIDEETAARMGGLANLLLLVSVDGPPAIHERRRGAGTHAALRRVQASLRRHGVLFGFATMVGRHNLDEVTTPEFVRGEADAGAVLGVYSRFFPLGGRADELALSADDVARELAALERMQRALPIPVFDLDEMEGHTGCRARSGCSIYIDGVSGQVAPCIRIPFAPPDCTIGPGRRLEQVLAHPFFAAHRSGEPSACGDDLAAVLARVSAELGAHARIPETLLAYRHDLDAQHARLAHGGPHA